MSWIENYRHRVLHGATINHCVNVTEFVYIYCLIENEIPFYVGRTTNIGKRMSEHKVKRAITRIDYSILDSVRADSQYVSYWEQFYISLFIFYGFKLENKIHVPGYKFPKPLKHISAYKKALERGDLSNNEINALKYLESIKEDKK